MNYAALIAFLAGLAFALPFLADLAEKAGVPRGLSAATTTAAAVVALLGVVLRARSQRRAAILERIDLILAQRARGPHDPDAFFLHGDHLGDLLLTLGRDREALAAFEAYQRVAGAAGRDTAAAGCAAGKLRRRLAAREDADAGV